MFQELIFDMNLFLACALNINVSHVSLAVRKDCKYCLQHSSLDTDTSEYCVRGCGCIFTFTVQNAEMILN